MTDRELDHVLADEPEIEPSGAFTEAVMKAVRRESQTPPSIEFPWLCAIPGIIAFGLTLAAVLAAPFYASGARVAPGPSVRFDLSIVQSALQATGGLFKHVETIWIGVGLLLTVVCIALPLHLVRSRS
jgi:hypothetical protein